MADEHLEVLVATVQDLLESGQRDTAVAVVDGLHPSDLAAVLTDLEPAAAAGLVLTLPPATAARGVWELDEPERRAVLQELPDGSVQALVGALPDDGGADLLGSLEDERRARVIKLLPAGRAAALARLLGHGEETAGALMSPRFVAVSPGTTASEVIDVLRAHRDTGFVYYVYVIGPRGEPLGTTSLRELVVADPNAPIDSLVHGDIVTVTPEADQEEVARLASRYDLLAVPVVSPEGRMLGVVTADDVLEVLSDEGEEDLERFVGWVEPEGGRPGLWRVVRGRAPWVLVAALVELPLALALLRPLPGARLGTLLAFLPLVLLAGGSAALAAAGTMLRRIAGGERRVARLLALELQGGILLGVLGAAATAGALFLAGTDERVVSAVAWAVGLAVMCAAAVGALVPTILSGLGRDPALASGPLVGILADAVALAVYLVAVRLEF